MASDAPAFESDQHDNAAIERGGRHPMSLRRRPRDILRPAPVACDHAFFLRVAHANAVQAELMKSSAIKLAESRELLADVP